MSDRTGTLRTLEELLLRRATEGLSAAEAAALDKLLTGHPHVDEHRYDFAAAAVLLATLADIEPMPESVRRKIVGAGRRRANS